MEKRLLAATGALFSAFTIGAALMALFVLSAPAVAGEPAAASLGDRLGQVHALGILPMLWLTLLALLLREWRALTAPQGRSDTIHGTALDGARATPAAAHSPQ